MERIKFERHREAHNLMDRLSLSGLTPAASQVWGSVRIVPLIREQVRGDLRLGLNHQPKMLTEVALDQRGLRYWSYVPSGLIVQWSRGEPVTSWAAQLDRLREVSDGEVEGSGWFRVKKLDRMVRRLDAKSIRMLPLHLAIEGFLGMHFGGPDVAYQCYTHRARRFGLDPAVTQAIPGGALAHLDEALRLFELHEGQCGALVYVGDALASAVVVPHPADYRAMHNALIEDFYAELFVYHSQYTGLPEFPIELHTPTRSIGALRATFEHACAQWADWEASHMGRDLLGRGVISERVRRMGPFSLQRFITDLQQGEQAEHIGEAIVREDGALEYLKTMRLSRTQVRRAQLLELLAEHEWDAEAAAASMGWTYKGLVREMKRAELDFVLHPELRPRARK